MDVVQAFSAVLAFIGFVEISRGVSFTNLVRCIQYFLCLFLVSTNVCDPLCRVFDFYFNVG